MAVSSNARTPKTPTSQIITWGPLAAIVVPLVIYLFSQLFAGMLLSIYPALRHWNETQAMEWVRESLVAQAVFMLLAGGISLMMLRWFLRHRQSSFRSLGLSRPKLRDAGYALAGFGVYFPALLVISTGIRVIAPALPLDQKQDIGFEGASGTGLLLVFVCLVLLPPIVEEILFRGFLYLGLVARFKKFWAVIITSALFALVHLQIGSGAPLVWSAALDTFVLSVVLVYLRDMTGGLWASIFLHMIKNGLAFLFLFIFKVA